MRFVDWPNLIKQRLSRRQKRPRQGLAAPLLSARLLAPERLENRVLLSHDGLHSHGVYELESQVQFDEPLVATVTPAGTSAFQFADGDRWSATFTSGSGLSQGDPTTVRWGIIPDGSSLPQEDDLTQATSSVIQFMDTAYGNDGGIADNGDLTQKPWFFIFNDAFERLEVLSGLTYTYFAINSASTSTYSIPNGSTNSSSTPEFLIGGHHIDGSSNVLAYNYFPNFGDMVIDTDDTSFFGGSSNSYRGARNVMMHEAGHGIGINHVESSDAAFLMEPFVSTSFDGPQLDDILAIHRGYGDSLEKGGGNNTSGTATSLGSISSGSTVSKGTKGSTTAVASSDTDFVSIDDESDLDFFSFTVGAAGTATLTLTPKGPTYQQGPQGGSQTSFNATSQNDLTLQLLSTDGTTVLQTVNVNGLGGTETITNAAIGAAGTYFARVSGATSNAVQLYQLDTTFTAATLAISGGDSGGNGAANGTADTFRLVRNGADLEVYLGNNLSQTQSFASIVSLTVQGSSDNDTLTLDFTGGDVLPAGGISFTGSTGTTNTLIVTGAGNVTTGSYAPSTTTNGSGTLTLNGKTAAFSGLTPVIVSGITDFTFTTPNGDDSLTIDSPAAGQNRISGTSGGVGFEAMTFSTITNFTLNASANDDGTPSDSVTLDASGLVATGLTSFALTTATGGSGTTLNGPINLSGNLSVTSGTITANSTIAASGSGTIALTSNGGAGLNVNNTVTSSSGTITLSADDDVIFAAAGDVTSTSGKITVTADDDATVDAGAGGAITMADGSVIDAGSGLIALSADESLAIGRLVTTSASATAVSITSISGSITDAGDASGANISAVNGTADLLATDNIGAAVPNGALETTVATLVASANGSTGLSINQTGNLVATLTANSGTATLNVASGTLITGGAWSAGMFDIDATGTITLAHNVTSEFSPAFGIDVIDINSSGGNLVLNSGVTLSSRGSVPETPATGPIKLTSHDVLIDVSGTPATVTAFGQVFFLPNTGRTVDLGAEGSGQFQLTDAELDRVITPDTVRVGDDFTGNVLFTAAVNMANADTLFVGSGATINDTGSTPVYTDISLALNTVGTHIGNTSPLNLATSNLETTSLGNTVIEQTGDVNVSAVVGSNGMVSTNGSVSLTVTGSVNVNNFSTGDTGITVDAQGGDAGDVFLYAEVSSDTGNVLIKADDEISGDNTGSLRVLDDANVVTNNRTLTLTADDDGSGIGTIDYAGLIQLNDNGSSGTFSLPGTTGVLSGAISGVGSVIKTGTGTLSLSAANTYTGTTTVSAGRLNVNGSLANGGAVTDVTIASGATLGGTGTINGGTRVSGTLAPGNSPGILNNVGNFAFADNSTFVVEIGGTTPGNTVTDHDQLNVTGTVTIGTTVTLTTTQFNGFVPVAGNSITIIANDDTDAISGTFNGLAEGATIGNFLGSGLNATISYVGGTGNDVVLSVSAGETSVALSGGNLIITDGNGGTSNDTLTIGRNGTYVRINDPSISLTAGAGATQVNANTVDVLLGSITGNIQVSTLAGNDTLTIDFSGGNPIPNGGISFAGGAQTSSDQLVLTDGTTTTVTHAFTNANDGSITLAGALAGIISYTGLEPVTDNLSATDRFFNFDGGAETITVTDDPAAGFTKIDSTLGESVTFANPSGLLTINAGTDDDTVTVTSVDAAYNVDLTINGNAGNDAVQVNGDITFASGENLLVNAESVSTSAGADLVTSGAGVITLTADDVAIDAASTLVSASTVTIKPQTANRTIDLGTDTVGSLSLTDTEIDQISTGTLVVGSASSGVITVSAAISAAVATDLTLISGAAMALDASLSPNGGNVTLTASGTITEGAATVLTATTLTTTSIGGTILTGSSNNVGTLIATNSGSGHISYVDADSFSVSGSNPVGNFSATATTTAFTGVLTVNAGNVSASGAVTLTADDMILTGTVTGSTSITLQPFTTSISIGLNDATGDLALSLAELQNLSTASLILGSATSGNMTLGSQGTVDLSGETISSVTLKGTSLTFNESSGSGLVLPNNATLVLALSGSVISSAAAGSTDVVIGGLSGTLDINVTAAIPATYTVGEQANPLTTSIAFLKGNSGQDVYLSEADTVQIAAAQSYSADALTLTMVAGTLQLTASGQIGNTTSVASAGPSASFDIGTFDESLEAIVLNDGSVIGTGTITAASDTYVENGLFSAKLAGTGILYKSFAGTVRMTNANTFSGGSVLTDGVLVVENDSALGSGTVRFDATATLRTGDSALSATRTLANALSLAGFGTTATIETPTGYPLIWNGAVSSDDDTSIIDKVGAASLTFNGNGSAYVGFITVSAGSLIVNGNFGNSKTVTVTNGTTLGGTGSLGPVTVQNGGDLSPGSSPAILDTDDLSLTTGSEVIIEIGGTTPGDAVTNHDQVNVTGTVDLGGATLTLSAFNGFVPAPGNSFVILANDSNDAITGTFNGLAEGASISSFLGSSLTATITYVGGTGNDVMLSIPDAVTVTVTPTSAAEDGSTNLVYTFTRGLTTGEITVDFNVTGTATFSTDYTQTGADSFIATAGTVTILDGSNTATITINPASDSTVELNETVVLTLVDGATYDIASPTVATGTITNDDSAVVNVTANSATEGSNVVYTVTLSNPVDVDVTVNFNTLTSGTATSGMDFTAVSNQTVTFSANTTTDQTVNVAALNDTLVEGSQTVVGQLSSLATSTRSVTLTGAAATLNATGTILDADTATVAFQSATSSLTEDGGTQNVVLVLTTSGNTLESSATFSIAAANGTASNADYDKASFPKTVTFAANSGDAATSAVSVVPTSDTLIEGSETLTLTASVSTGVATLGAQTTNAVTITDADTATVAFQSATSNAGEETGAHSVTLVLTTAAGNTLVNAATFSISAANGTASNGDYDNGAFPKTVTFASNSGNGSTQSVTLTPTSDTTLEGTETVTLTASISTGVATLGAQTTHIVSILSDDTPDEVYVDDDWAGLTYGDDPDGGGPALGFGIDAFDTIQGGVNAVSTSGTVHVYAGPYAENVTINRSMAVDGVSGTATLPEADAVVLDPAAGNAITITAPATTVILSDLTVTGAVNGIVASGTVNLTLSSVLSTSHSGTGLSSTSTGDLTINGGTYDDMNVSGADDIVLGATSVMATDNVSLSALNSVNLTGSLNAGSSTVTISANADSSGSQGFSMSAGTSITTTNDTASAVSVTVNSLTGGTGTAALGLITTGATPGSTGGRVTVDANNGVITDANGASANVTAGNAVLRGLAGVGSSGDAIETTIQRLEAAGAAGGVFVVNSGVSLLSVGGISSVVGLSSTTGSLDIRTDGALTIEEDVSTSSTGSVFLKAAETAGSDDLTVNSGVTVSSTNSSVTLQAGDNVTSIATSVINAGQAINITGDSGDSDAAGTTLTISSRLVSGTGTTLTGGDDNDSYNITYPTGATNSGTVTLSDAGGTDAAIINGTATADTIYLTAVETPNVPTSEQITRGSATAEPILVPNSMESLRINTLAGNDTINAQPTTLYPVTVDGGVPVTGDPGVPPGDTLNVDPLGGVISLVGSDIQVTNGATTYQLITPISIETQSVGTPTDTTAQRYDFNGRTVVDGGFVQTPTQSGFTGVTSDTVYTAALGYGWSEPLVSVTDGTNTAADSALVNDAHIYSTGTALDVPTFTANVTNGQVQVTVVLGHPTLFMDGIRIRNADNDDFIVENLSTAIGESLHRTFLVNVTDGTLSLRFEDALNNRMIAISGLVIRTPNLSAFFISSGATTGLAADGATIDTFGISGGASNSLITVSPTLGTLAGTDADPLMQGFQITTNGVGAGTVQIRRPSTSGDSTLLLTAATGEGQGSPTISYSTSTVNRFDFDTPSAVTQAGYTSVLTTNLYSTTTGYGWLASPRSYSLSTPVVGSLASLINDGHRSGSPGTFRTNIANGTYDVHVSMGDNADHAGLSVTANGTTALSNLAISRDTVFEKTFAATVTNGVLDLTFSQAGSTVLDPYWMLNGLEVRATSAVGAITPINEGSVAADGSTVATIEATSALTAGTLVTVSSTLGTITTADADSRTVGTQVLIGAGGSIAFNLQAPRFAGTPTVEWRTLDGSHRQVTTDAAFLTFAAGSGAASVRRYDFNRGSTDATMSATAAGFIGVRSNHNSPATDGFGWLAAPSAFNSASVPNGITTTALYRDGHRGATGTSGTFRVQAAAATTYDVRVYVGQFGQTLDQVRIAAEGATAVIAPATNWDQFTTVTIAGVTDTNANGFIDITLNDAGGSATGWAIVGLDIANTGNLPSATALQAAIVSNNSASSITPADLATAMETAKLVVSSAPLTVAQAAALKAVQVSLADLNGLGQLGQTSDQSILIDDNGAGLGWSLTNNSVQTGRYDLLSVLVHELGHAIGRDHSDDGVMSPVLTPGSHAAEIDEFFAQLADDLLVN